MNFGLVIFTVQYVQAAIANIFGSPVVIFVLAVPLVAMLAALLFRSLRHTVAVGTGGFSEGGSGLLSRAVGGSGFDGGGSRRESLDTFDVQALTYNKDFGVWQLGTLHNVVGFGGDSGDDDGGDVGPAFHEELSRRRS